MCMGEYDRLALTMYKGLYRQEKYISRKESDVSCINSEMNNIVSEQNILSLDRAIFSVTPRSRDGAPRRQLRSEESTLWKDFHRLTKLYLAAKGNSGTCNQSLASSLMRT